MKHFFLISILFLLFESSITTAQWVPMQFQFNAAVRTFASYPNESGGRNLFAGTEGAGVFLSTNDGASWTAVNNGLTDLTVYSLTISGTNIFAGTEIGGLFRSTNNGTSWSSVNAGFTGSEVYSFAVSDTDIYAGAFWGGVFRSTDDGNSWSNLGLYYVLSLLKTDGYLYAGTAAGQVWRSSDNGSNWLPSNTGLLYTTYSALSMTPNGNDSTNLFASSHWDSAGVFCSSDSGVNWNQFNAGLTNKQINALTASGSNLFAGTGFLGGVFLLTSTNSMWIPVNEGFTYPFYIVSLGISGDYIFAGTLTSGGVVWRRPLSDIVPVELTSFSAILNDDNVELSWITSTETNNQGFEIQRSKEGEFETIGFVEGHGTTTESQAYSFTDNNVIAGNYNYRLKQIDFDGTFEYSNVIEVEIASPSTFSLEQNYPNPFNPNTKIRYTIPNVIASETKQSQFVSLKIYDVLGNEVATLVDEYKPAGSYEVEFDASNLPSGTYFYQLKAGEFTAVKKMILLK